MLRFPLLLAGSIIASQFATRVMQQRPTVIVSAHGDSITPTNLGFCTRDPASQKGTCGDAVEERAIARAHEHPVIVQRGEAITVDFSPTPLNLHMSRDGVILGMDLESGAHAMHVLVPDSAGTYLFRVGAKWQYMSGEWLFELVVR